MIKRNTWIMIAIFLLLLVLTFIPQQAGDEADPFGEQPTQPEPAPLLFDVPLDSITGLRVARTDGRALSLEKSDDGWLFVDPKVEASLVDQAKIEALLAQLTAMRTLTEGSINAPLSALQLENAPFELIVSTSSGETLVLKIGSSSPTGDGYYVSFENQVPLLAAKNPLDQVISFLDVPPLLLPETPTDENPAP